MCGIAGIVTTSGLRDSDLLLVDRMLASLSHCGPDEQRLFADGSAAIGARRLDHRPRSGWTAGGSEDGSIQVPQYGGIAYHVELREIARTLLATRLVDRREWFAVPWTAWFRADLGSVYREWSSVRTQ